MALHQADAELFDIERRAPHQRQIRFELQHQQMAMAQAELDDRLVRSILTEVQFTEKRKVNGEIERIVPVYTGVLKNVSLLNASGIGSALSAPGLQRRA